MKTTIPRILLLAILLTALSSCYPPGGANPPQPGGAPPLPPPGAGQPPTNSGATPTAAPTAPASVVEALAGKQVSHDRPEDYDFDPDQAIPIRLDGNRITTQGEGVRVDGSQATITAAGDYRLSGTLSDGEVRVDAGDDEVVRLILDGASITNQDGAAINILAADKVVILLAENSQNELVDGSSYVFDSVAGEEPNAALFSKADLTLAGSGALSVTGNFRDGIHTNDGLVIAGGSITIHAVDDGIRGKDYVVVKDGQIDISAQGDGLKADNEEDADRGYLVVENGDVRVRSGGDALYAFRDVVLSGGSFEIQSGGGSESLVGNASAKAIKGLTNVIIAGGTFNLDAADDGVHSNANITIHGGDLQIASGDDGMHADATLTIHDGTVRVSQSYEGLESAVITLNGGRIDVASRDDGINVAGGMDNSGRRGPGRGPGGGPETFAGGRQFLYINGGLVTVSAQGDGLDVNGAVEMTGGTVIVHGPTAQFNAALDHSGFKISGGIVMGAGSAGMAQTTEQNSSQPGVMIYFTATQPAGSVVHIQNSKGENVLTFAPLKGYDTLAFSTPGLVKGETYTIFTGGSASGEAIGGFYPDGGYSPGTEYAQFTVSGMVTTIGTGGRSRRRF